MSLHSRHFHRGNLTYDNMRFGVILITWGLFKKPVIVDGVGHLR
jgi:D-alanyl-lipoteichoic acid acyltransferase DltB (MBOAT superfamily)